MEIIPVETQDLASLLVGCFAFLLTPEIKIYRSEQWGSIQRIMIGRSFCRNDQILPIFLEKLQRGGSIECARPSHLTLSNDETFAGFEPLDQAYAIEQHTIGEGGSAPFVYPHPGYLTCRGVMDCFYHAIDFYFCHKTHHLAGDYSTADEAAWLLGLASRHCSPNANMLMAAFSSRSSFRPHPGQS
jgi:hypothetical protein